MRIDIEAEMIKVDNPTTITTTTSMLEPTLTMLGGDDQAVEPATAKSNMIFINYLTVLLLITFELAGF